MRRLLRWRLATALLFVAVAALCCSAYRAGADRQRRYARAGSAYGLQIRLLLIAVMSRSDPNLPPAIAGFTRLPQRLDDQTRARLLRMGIDPEGDLNAAMNAYGASHIPLVRACDLAASGPTWRVLLNPVDLICACPVCDLVAGRIEDREGPSP